MQSGRIVVLAHVCSCSRCELAARHGSKSVPSLCLLPCPKVQAALTLDDAVAQLNAGSSVTVDLEGRKINCSSHCSPVLTVSSEGGMLKNGIIAVTAGTGLFIDSDCSLQLQDVTFEVVASQTDPADGKAGVPALLALAPRAMLDAQAVRIDGAAGPAICADLGAKVTGSKMYIRGAQNTAVVITGAHMEVADLAFEECAAACVLCQQNGRLTATNLKASRNAGVVLQLSGGASADLSKPVIQCNSSTTAVHVQSSSRLTCQDGSVQGDFGSTGFVIAGAGTTAAVKSCSLSSMACALQVDDAAEVTLLDCTVSHSGTDRSGVMQ